MHIFEMKMAFGRLHNGGVAAFGGHPAFVEIIMVDEMCNKKRPRV